jgi:hypothetical protein
MRTARRLMYSRTVQFTSYHHIQTNVRPVSVISTTVPKRIIGSEHIDPFQIVFIKCLYHL